MKILVIPDTQSKPGVPNEHLGWIGQYAVDKRPDVIVHIGDHWDMPSLSSYDVGKKSFEGRTYKADIEAGNTAMDVLMAPISAYNKALRVAKSLPIKEYNAAERRRSEKLYKPRLVFCVGNHEQRIERAIESDRKLENLMGYHDFNLVKHGWVVHPFLKPVEIGGVHFAHYFYNPMTGKPYGGMIQSRLKNIGFSFVMGHQQGKQQAEMHRSDGTIVRGLVVGSCLTPDHKVLTADLRYVPLGEVQPGDKLVSFEEFPERKRKRGYETGTVQAVRRDRAQCYAVTLATGKVFRVTEDHQWLTRVNGPLSARAGSSYLWRTTKQLRRGTLLPQMLEEWTTLDSRDAGYLAGMYDGEGSLYARPSGGAGGAVMQLALSQKPGPVLERCRQLLTELCGAHGVTDTNQRGVSTLRVRGGAKHCAKILGAVRPSRMLSKFTPELLGSAQTGVDTAIVDIQPIGEQEIVRIAIDRKTMIVEGYPHHNCYQHDEDYLGPQGVNYWRGVVMLHQVRDGNYDLMEVSLEYLRSRYGGKKEAL